MKRITKGRLNAIENAGCHICNYDTFSELSDKEIEEHHLIGELLREHKHEVLRLMIRLYNEETVSDGGVSESDKLKYKWECCGNYICRCGKQETK